MNTQATAPAPQPQSQPDYSKIRFQFLEEPIRRNKFMWFLRKLLTFVGAIIVFGTFIVKDGMRERLRDATDRLTRVQDLYTIRADIVQLAGKVDSITIRRSRFLNQHEYPDPPPKKKDIEEAGEWIEDEVETDRLMFDNQSTLLDTLPLPHRSETISEMAGAQAKLDELMDISSKGLYGPGAAKNLLNSLDVGQQFINHFNWARWNISEEATEAKETAEHRYSLFTWASYFLYTLGWGLGLVGRLVGVNTGGDD